MGCISNTEEEGYEFQWADPGDEEIKLTSFGFCDDNTKFAATEDKDLVIKRTQEHVDLTRD